MDEAEFDKFADEYYVMHSASITASGEGPEYFAEYKIKDIAREFGSTSSITNTAELRVLDFGAGNGGSIPYVHKHIPNAQLTCLDVSRRSLEIAEKRFPSLARYVHFDGIRIPLPDNYFDIAYAACVFHHIDHAEHISLLAELYRVIRPGGYLFVFEHNPYNPLTVHVVNNCPFDENAHLIRGYEMKKRLIKAGFVRPSNHYRVFFPHALRLLRPLERMISWLPLGGQYYSVGHK